MRLIAFFVLINALSSANAQGLIPYNKNGKFGLCDIHGKLKVEPQYNSISFFNPKLAGYSIEKEGKFGLMDGNLQMVIPPTANQPIFSNGDYVIAKEGNELIYYDKKYKEVTRQQLTTSGKEDGLVYPIYPAEYPQQLGYSREEVIKMFKEKFGNKYKDAVLNVFSANNTYFKIESFAEGKRKNEGIFLPKTETFLLNDEEVTYQSAVWISSKKSYYIKIMQTGGNKGIITHEGKIVFEPKQYSYLALMPNYIAYNPEPSTSTGSIAYYYMISSGNSIKNEFSNFRYSTSVLDNGKEFEVFSVVVENPALHKSAQVFIGENGMKYYDLEYAK
ncbi:WG repeat-containing protein [Chryseobacterium camelliae]|uniref:WG repeat-containing protein n=1 Tax=Chryseobacterium camelliae TaxID=1265445 RepID=A0ABY7QNQ6_9FLAO|nr:WG repeat-containing protein [Chryseobacterium camelliae]WBV61252.1 WG repeat-containing protein [Chryseobacterium camelliae]